MKHANAHEDTAKRRSQIAAIQVMRQQLSKLGMDDDAYRAMLERVSAFHGAPVRSAAKLNGFQRRAVIEEMRRLGAAKPAGQGGTRYPGKPHNFDSPRTPELMTKIEALLADMKLPWSYADAIAKQQAGIARVAWVRDGAQLRAIVAALDLEREKRLLDQAVAEQLKRLGWEPARVVELLKPLRANWRRHRPSLRLVLEFLTVQEVPDAH